MSRVLLPLAASLSAVLLSTSPATASQDLACFAFDDALAVAAQRAPEVQAARARLDAAEADVREAQSLLRPQVSTFGRTAVGDNGLTSNQLENQVGVRVSQRVFDFGDARLARASAAGRRDQRASDVATERAGAAIAVAEAYLIVLETRAMIEVTRERRDYFDRQAQALEELLARGGATRADLAQVVAQRAEAEADMLELNFRVDRGLARIRAYTGSEASPCGADAVSAFLDRQLGDITTVDQVLAEMLLRNPVLAAQRSAIRGLEADRDRQRRARLPVVDVVGIASYVYDDAREDWEPRDRVGVDVSVPLVTGNALGARADRANALLATEQSTLRTLQRDLGEQGEVLFRETIALRAQLFRRDAVADSQRAYFEAISEEFEFGLGTLPDIVDARLAYERALLDALATRFALLRQQVLLMNLTARIPLPSLEGERSE